jgi:hypothetical protein
VRECPDIGVYAHYEGDVSNPKCVACDSNCMLCKPDGDGTECSQCPHIDVAGQYLSDPDKDGFGTCIDDCPAGTYGDSSSKWNPKCVPCDSPCLECGASTSDCTKCGPIDDARRFLSEEEGGLERRLS